MIRAQVGVTTDIITGQITSPEGQPGPGVTVRVASIETQIGRNATTNKRAARERRPSLSAYSLGVTAVGKLTPKMSGTIAAPACGPK